MCDNGTRLVAMCPRDQPDARVSAFIYAIYQALTRRSDHAVALFQRGPVSLMARAPNIHGCRGCLLHDTRAHSFMDSAAGHPLGRLFRSAVLK